MLEPIMAKAIAAEISNVHVTVESVEKLLESAAESAESSGQPIHDIYPRACAAALDGIAMRLQELGAKILEQAGLS